MQKYVRFRQNLEVRLQNLGKNDKIKIISASKTKVDLLEKERETGLF